MRPPDGEGSSRGAGDGLGNGSAVPGHAPGDANIPRDSRGDGPEVVRSPSAPDKAPAADDATVPPPSGEIAAAIHPTSPPATGKKAPPSSLGRSIILTVRGTRALVVGGFLLLALAILEPALPPAMSRLWLVLPIVVLIAVGLLTLPVEGVVAQQRARALVDHPSPMKPLVKRSIWIGILCILLLPQLFLAAYGIPHMNPFTGLLLPTIQRRISLGFLYFVLLIPIFYLRSSRLYAPAIRRGDHEPRTRDGLLVMTYGLAIAWGILLEPFWRPFSLLVWPPDLSSLVAGVRGVAAITFSIVIPLVLFMSLAAHLEMLRVLWYRGQAEWRAKRPMVAMAVAHIVLILLAVTLHAYDLLWIVRYEAASGL